MNSKKTYKNIAKLVKNGNNKDAIEAYKQLIQLQPTIKFLKELGELYEKERMYYEAVECYVKVLHKEKNDISVIGVLTNQIGTCYYNIQQYKLAFHYFKKVIQIKELSDVYANMALCCVNLKMYKEGEEYLLRSYQIDKSHYQTTTTLGEIYYHTKKYKKSIEYYKQNLIPDNYTQLYNLSFAYLSDKQFKLGFELYDNRLKFNRINKMTNIKERLEIPLEYWDGKTTCNRLLIVSEQGLGDNIQYYRFIIELSEKYPEMKITYFCKQEISHLFHTYKNVEIIDSLTFYIYDYKIFLMSLPHILQLSTIVPNHINYIRTNPEKRIYWKEKLDDISPRLKVGFVYNGLLTSYIEKHIPLKEFESLCDLDIDLVCIHRKSDLEKDVMIDSERFHHFDIDTEAPFEDTIHILQNIDLLITIDTFIVHLAGILNVKTWLLLGISEWRWSDGADKSYWYNSVDFIRTKQNQRLTDIMPTVKEKLSKWIQEEPNKKTEVIHIDIP